MSPVAPRSTGLGRAPIAGTIVVAIAAAGMIASWQLGLSADKADEASASALLLYLLAFGLAVWVMIHGASLAWRWLGWLADRALPEWLGRVLHWAVPVAVAAVVIGLFGPIASSTSNGSHPMAAAVGPLIVLALVTAGLVLALVYFVRGARRHRDRAKRARGWLPDHEIVGRDEASRWNHAWHDAIEASRRLRRREVPPTVQPLDVMTRQGEQVFLDRGVEYSRLYGTDGSYVHTSGLYLGSPLFVATGLATNAIGNAAARSRAARESAVQWRETQPARVLVTSQRLLVHVASGWLTFDHGLVISFHPEPAHWHMVIEYQGVEPVRLAGMAAPHVAVLLASILRGPALLDEHPAFAPLRVDVDDAPSDRPTLDEV